jgi:hypothetical protein
LGKIGGDNPQAFGLIAETAEKAFGSDDFTLATAAGEALVSLGNPKGLAVLEQISQNTAIPRQLRSRFDEYRESLRKSVAGTAQGTKAKEP